MIEPKDIKKRTITISGLESGTAEDQANKIVQTNVCFGKKSVTLLVGLDLVLKFEYKKQRCSKRLNILREKILKDKKIFSTEKQTAVQKILLSDREIRELINRDAKELIQRDKSAFGDFTENLKRRETQLKDSAVKNKFSIIESHKYYYCAVCNGFRSGPDLAQGSVATCNRCQNVLKKMAIARIANDVVGYFTGNWFEDYVANVLSSNGWRAWSSPNMMVYGVSGAPHQVDVLAIKNGVVLIIECKTGDFTPIQVRNFLGKYYDVRCHKAFAISIGGIHPDGIKIIEKNPAIDYYDKITSTRKLEKKISEI